MPSYLAASFSISGATILQGPHQAAQKSTSTGLSLLMTIDFEIGVGYRLDVGHCNRILSPVPREVRRRLPDVIARQRAIVWMSRYASRTRVSVRR